MAALGGRATADDTVIGSVFAWILGLGALFLSIFTTSESGTGGAGGDPGVNVLFGSILGLTTGQAPTDAVVALVVVGPLVAIGRPILFASLDPEVAAARGVPVRPSGSLFFVLLGVTTGVATQAVGALLLLGLLAAPAGAAQRLASRPLAAMWISAASPSCLGWIGLTVAYLNPDPPSFGILAVSTGSYLVVLAVTLGRGHVADAMLWPSATEGSMRPEPLSEPGPEPLSEPGPEPGPKRAPGRGPSRLSRRPSGPPNPGADGASSRDPRGARPAR